MDAENTKTKVLSSLIWKFMERGGSQGIQFIVQIILARLLLPSDYGAVALIFVFIIIANVFVQSGLNTALIQKKDADDTDFSSVFYLSLSVAAVMYAILFFAAPGIAAFYNSAQLTVVLRVVSVTLFFGAVNSIQNAAISKNMQFKKLFFSSLGAVAVSGAVSILMAYAGFGIWVLVVQELTNKFMVTLILWFTAGWRPKPVFSLERVKGLFSYGWKLLVSSLLDTFYINLQSLIIGKFYSPSTLGFYNRGDSFPQIIVMNINGSIQSVMLPVIASEQDNRKRVKEMVRRSIVTSSFVVFPMLAGLAVIAEPLVRIILTDKWLPCVPYLQIFCAVYALWPVHTANLQAINALGRSDIYLKLEIIKKSMGLLILTAAVPHGPLAMAAGTLAAGVIGTFINAYPNSKLFNYKYMEQMKDIMPSLVLSLAMAAAINNLKWLHAGDAATIAMQVLAGCAFYVGAAVLLRLESYSYLLATIKEMLGGRTGASKKNTGR